MLNKDTLHIWIYISILVYTLLLVCPKRLAIQDEALLYGSGGADCTTHGHGLWGARRGREASCSYHHMHLAIGYLISNIRAKEHCIIFSTLEKSFFRQSKGNWQQDVLALGTAE